MKTELTEQKNKFIRKVKSILFTLGPFIIILINLANIIIITSAQVVKEDMFKYSTTKLGKAMEKVQLLSINT